MKRVYHLTAHGKRELEDELEQLISGRDEIADRIATAREFGDLSENAEYSAARDEQARTESRIAEIEEILRNVELIASDGDDTISLGDTVVLQQGKTTVEYKIVGEVEADPLNGKISHHSSLGEALIGKKPGEKITVDAPRGKIDYEILEVK